MQCLSTNNYKPLRKYAINNANKLILVLIKSSILFGRQAERTLAYFRLCFLATTIPKNFFLNDAVNYSAALFHSDI